MKLNPVLDADDLAHAFKMDDRLRVPEILSAETANELVQTLEAKSDFRHILVHRGHNKALLDQDLRSMPRADREIMIREVLDNASRGHGFYYSGHHLKDCTEPSLIAFNEFLQSAPMLDFIHSVTGKKVSRADAQATLYRPGHFLTRHLDRFDNDHRELAFVFNLSRHWHPDWGGLLQFYEKNGTPRDAWAPGMNVLSLFDTRHIHAVTYVAPFAKAGRYAITGWFY